MGIIPQILKIEITSIPFLLPNGGIISKSANIIFKNEYKGEDNVTLGYYTKDEIFNWIKDGEEIILDYCYIDQFSFSDYRLEKELDRRAQVIFKGISACNAIFNPSKSFDLSYGVIQNGDLKFEHSLFLRGNINFHSLSKVSGEISFANSMFSIEKLDFANARLGKGKINFKNTIFEKGFKDFQYCHFGEGEIVFTNADFGSGDVSFINSSFGECDISFKIARFGEGKLDFHYAHFQSGDVNFERADFGNGFVDFRKVEWNNNRVNFNRSVFGIGGVSFEESEMKQGKFLFKKATVKDGGFNFSSALFDNIELNFEGTNFGKSGIYFKDSKFQSISLKGCHLDNYTDLRVRRAKSIDLSDTIIRDIVDMKPIGDEVNISTVQFEGMRLVGSLYIGWNENDVLSLITTQENTSLASKAEQFRTLKQNFNKTGQYSDEDNAYVYFKRYESKAQLNSQLKGQLAERIFAWPSYAFKWLVFDKIGLYATSPGRVLVSIVFIFVFFAFLLFLGQLSHLGNITSSVGNPDHLSVLSQSFYHSAITFFTIGYGDTYPQGIDRLISALEGFVGVFMMSYFTVAFVRKILR